MRGNEGRSDLFKVTGILYLCVSEKYWIMATVIIDTRSKEAKKMLEYLKTTRYAKVVEDKIPNEETIKAMKDAEDGNLNNYTSADELIKSLKNKAGV